MMTGILWAIAIGILIVVLEAMNRKERRIHERKWKRKKETIGNEAHIQQSKKRRRD